MRRALLVLLVSACGGGSPECTAIFSGNFSDFVSAKAACPQFSESTLRFELTAVAAQSRLAVALDLGPNPTPGTFTSQSTVGDWSATSTREPGCVYAGGAKAVPAGRYTLVLDSIDAKTGPHGSLMLLQAVHALDGIDCGRGDQERVQLEF